MSDEMTRIAVSKDRREELRSLKRGGESYEELIGKMIDQYDPEQAMSVSPDGGETESESE